MPAQVLSPSADTCLVRLISHAVANAATDLGPERAPELAHCLATGAVAQSLEQKIRQIYAGLPFVIAQLTPAQIVDDGAGRVETRGHGQKGAGKWQYRGRVAQAVKSRASGQPRARRLRAWLVLGLLASAWLPPVASARQAAPASAQLNHPIAMQRGQPTAARAGESAPSERAPSERGRRCSLTRPICVEGEDLALVPSALRFLTEAYEVTVFGNQGPAWGVDRLAQPILWRLANVELSFEVKPEPSLGFARGRPTCVGGPITFGTALACASGSALARTAPGTQGSLLGGAARYLSRTWAPSDGATGARGSPTPPENGLITSTSAQDPALLMEQVASKASSGGRVAAVWLAVTLAATASTWTAASANPEPDFFDVLRHTLGGQDPHLAQFFDELAVLRFTRPGERSTEQAEPEVAWEIEAASLPRNVVLPRPLLPTGSAYLIVRLDSATKRAGLAVRTFCETGTRYVWSLARLGRGRVLQSRVPVPARQSDTNAEGVIVELADAEEVLIVGTSLGGGPGEDFDPDLAPPSAHSCEVALDRLPNR